MAEARTNHPSLPPNYVTITDLRERWLKQKQKQSQPEEEGNGQIEKKTDSSFPPNYTTIEDLRERWLKNQKQKQPQEKEEGRGGQTKPPQQPQSQLPNLSSADDQPLRLEKAGNGDHKTEYMESQRQNGATTVSKQKSEPSPCPNPKRYGTINSTTRRPSRDYSSTVKPMNRHWIPAATSHPKPAQAVMERRETVCYVSAVSLSSGTKASGQKTDDRSAEEAFKGKECNKKEEEVTELVEEVKTENKNLRENGHDEVMANPKQKETKTAENVTAISAKWVKVLEKEGGVGNFSSVKLGKNKLEQNREGEIKEMVGGDKLEKKNKIYIKNKNDGEKGNHRQEGKKTLENETANVTGLVEVSRNGECVETSTTILPKAGKDKPKQNKGIKETVEEENVEKKRTRKKKKKKYYKNKDDGKENFELKKTKAAETETAIVAASVEVSRNGNSLQSFTCLNTGRDKPNLNDKLEEDKKMLGGEKAEEKKHDKKYNRHKSYDPKANPKQEGKKAVKNENGVTAESVEMSRISVCAENISDPMTEIEQNLARPLTSSSYEQGESSGRRMYVANNKRGWRRDGGYGKFASRVTAKQQQKDAGGFMWVKKGDSSSVNVAGV